MVWTGDNIDVLYIATINESRERNDECSKNTLFKEMENQSE